MVFAYAGTPAFFSIISEMRDPKHYTRSLAVCQGTVTVTYTVIGIVVYYYCGSYVSSPALGSAGHTMKKVCYGIALPGLLVSCLILLHVSPSPERLNITDKNSCLPNTSSFVFLKAPSISQATLQLTGLSGLVAHSLAQSLHGSLPVSSPSLVASFPLSVLFLVHSCPFNRWVACGCTTIGTDARQTERYGGRLGFAGVFSSSCQAAS